MAKGEGKSSSGGGDDVEASSVDVILPEGFGASFSDRVIRAKFVRKVYAILLSQLAVTTAVVAIFCLTPAIKEFYCAGVITDPDTGLQRCARVSSEGTILHFVSLAIFLVAYLSLACCERLRKRSPGNVIAMCVFTLALSVVASSIAIHYNIYWVMMALGITAALCLGLTFFSFQTKWDFTGKPSSFLRNQYAVLVRWTHVSCSGPKKLYFFLYVSPPSLITYLD